SDARFIQLVNNPVMRDAERPEIHQLFLEWFAFHRMTCQFIECLTDRTLLVRMQIAKKLLSGGGKKNRNTFHSLKASSKRTTRPAFLSCSPALMPRSVLASARISIVSNNPAKSS